MSAYIEALDVWRGLPLCRREEAFAAHMAQQAGAIVALRKRGPPPNAELQQAKREKAAYCQAC